MKNTTKILAALAFALALALVPLAGCVGEGAAEGGTDNASAPATAIDTSSWKTMADAYAAVDEVYASGSNDSVCVTVFKAGDNFIRVVSDYDPSYDEKSMELSFMDEDYLEKAADVFGDLAIQSAEDITADLVDENALAAYVGKTGQDLIDDGFVFIYYNGYGGEETYAAFDKGYFAYEVTFDATITDDTDEGAAIMGAAITDIQMLGISDDATNPENV